MWNANCAKQYGKGFLEIEAINQVSRIGFFFPVKPQNRIKSNYGLLL